MKYKKAMKKVLKNPPQKQEIKNFTFKKLSNDDIFILSVKLPQSDIGVLFKDEQGNFDTYLISEFEAAKARVKRAEEWEKMNIRDAKNFKLYLDSKDIYMSDYEIDRTARGYMPFGSRCHEIYKDFLCSAFHRMDTDNPQLLDEAVRG